MTVTIQSRLTECPIVSCKLKFVLYSALRCCLLTDRNCDMSSPRKNSVLHCLHAWHTCELQAMQRLCNVRACAWSPFNLTSWIFAVIFFLKSMQALFDPCIDLYVDFERIYYGFFFKNDNLQKFIPVLRHKTAKWIFMSSCGFRKLTSAVSSDSFKEESELCEF